MIEDCDLEIVQEEVALPYKCRLTLPAQERGQRYKACEHGPGHVFLRRMVQKVLQVTQHGMIFDALRRSQSV